MHISWIIMLDIWICLEHICFHKQKIVPRLYKKGYQTIFDFHILLPANNLWGPNIVDISGALFIMSLSKLNSKYEESARDVNNIWVPEITRPIKTGLFLAIVRS